MSPILLRPIREQFEHNRVIRLLQTRLRRRYLVGVNLEDEPEATGVRSGTGLVYPDLVLTSTTGARRLHGVVEVETAESVNHLEAMTEWVHFGKVRGAFYLYVPAGATDIALQLCEGYAVAVTEIWSYHAVGDQMRFTRTHRSARAASRAAAAAKRATKSAKQTSKRVPRGAGQRAGTSTPRNARSARRSRKTVKRPRKTAQPSAKTVSRTPRTAKRAAKTSVAKAASATKRTAKSAKRRTSSGGTTSSRARTAAAKSASKTRRRSTAAGTKKTAASRPLRKQR